MEAREKKNFWGKLGKAVGIVFLLCILGFVSTFFVPKYNQYKEYQERVKFLSDDVESLRLEVSEFQKRRQNFVSDRNYARRIAHEHGFSEKDEVVFRFLDDPTL